jgi:hypothetical protein
MKRPGPNFQDMMGECGRVGLVLQRSAQPSPPDALPGNYPLLHPYSLKVWRERRGQSICCLAIGIRGLRVSSQEACCVWFREVIPEVRSHPALPGFFEVLSVFLVSPFAWADWFRVLCESSCARVGSTRVVLFWSIVFLLGGGTILVVLFWLF